MKFRRWLPLFALLGGCFDPETVSEDGTDASSGSTAGPSTVTMTTTNPATTDDGSTSGSTTGETTMPSTTMTTSMTMTTTMTTTTDESETASSSSTTDPTDTMDTGSSSSSDSSSSSGEPAACGMAELCIESAPVGWDGPTARFAVAGPGAPVGCAAPFADEVTAGFLNFMFGPASCACSCSASANATCGNAGAAVYGSGDTICDDALGGGSLTTSCSSLAGGFNNYALFAPLVNGGSCAPQFGTTLPPPVNTNARTLCEPAAAPAACVGEPGLCFPEYAESRYCVSRPGDFECPAGSAYSTREVIHSALDDSRGCSQCTCGGAAGTCTATATLYTGGACSGGTTTRPVDGSCRNEPSPASGRLTSVSAAGATCPPSGGSPLGTVVASEVTTTCCGMF